MEQLLESKTNVFFGPQHQTHIIGSTTLTMTRVVQIVLRQQVITNTGTQQREDGSTMRHVAPEHLSPCRTSLVLATRETRHIRFTLGGLSLGVVFSSRWLCRSRSSTAISQTATTLLVLDGAKIVVAQHRLSLIHI